MSRPPRILVFDSGLGGLTVYDEIVRAQPGAHYLYVADDAAFPYGRIYGAQLLARVEQVVDWLIARYEADVVVIACNTASTLVLPHLRARFPDKPFVGTVPAVKPAAAASRSGLISVLATPGTVERDYTRTLVHEYASRCRVALVGSSTLAPLAEAFVRGERIRDEDVAAEIAPCFVEENGERTDQIVLACTHYPLLRTQFERLAPWPVGWIDPAPAIARRVVALLEERGLGKDHEPAAGEVVFTSGRPIEGALADVLRGRRLFERRADALPYQE
ncbi:MAG TPA: glutamate racemase [Beijerinckiaceae bacterium]|nr:glutamate racemase [Beijerinckiaceae bacterium]